MKQPHSPQRKNPRYKYVLKPVSFGFDFLIITSWHWSKSFFVIIGSCFPSCISPPYRMSPQKIGFLSISCMTEIESSSLFIERNPSPVIISLICRRVYLPLAYVSNAFLIYGARSESGMIIFFSLSFTYPIGAFRGQIPSFSLFLCPRLIFSDKLST